MSSEPYLPSGKPDFKLSSEPRWVSRLVVETIHADLIQQHGGSHGVRDIPLLESALDRPRNRPNDDPGMDVAALAASYAIGIASTHAFVDGNIRAAFQVMYVFLGLHGYRVVAAESDVVALMVDVATGAVDEVTLAAWCRANAVTWK